MRKILDFAAGHPYPVLALLLLISLLAALRLPDLRIHITPESLHVEGDPDQAFYDQSIATFGSNNIVVLYLQDPALFATDNIEAIRKTVADLEGLPFVSRTQSLFSIPYLRVENELVIARPFLADPPGSPAATADLIAAAGRNPFVLGNLLSGDGRAMAINIYLEDPEEADPDYDEEVSGRIDALVAPLRDRLQFAFQIGLPYVRTAIREQLQQDQFTIMPAAVGVLLVTLLLVLQRPNGAVIPLLTAGMSVLWTLGAMAFLGIELNVMTAVVPVLLIIVGSTEDIHLISEFFAGVHSGYMRRRALGYMARRMGLAVLLTFLTSFLGFLSVASSPIQLVREFGLIAAMGLGINFAITLLLVPAYLRLFGDGLPAIYHRVPYRPRHRLLTTLVRSALVHRRMFLLFTLGVTVLCLASATRIRIDNNILSYFDADSEVTQRVERVHQQLSGLETLSVILDGHIDGTFKQVRYLSEVLKLQAFLDRDPAFDFNASFADYLALLNSVVNDSGEPELPGDDEVIQELLLFVKHRDVAAYISPDFSRTSVVVRHNLDSSFELNRALADLKAFVAANIDPDLDVRVIGESILSNNAADQMARSQAYSLALMLLVIFTVIGLLFVNPRAGLLAVLPNLFLVLVLFGVMGSSGIPLDTGTAMIAAIALGVCVDHTMHFMVRYNRVLRQGLSEEDAILQTIRDEATPISAASLALAAGLGTLTLSGFTPVAHFGALSALVMLLAFYANFFITPLLLSHIRLVSLWDLLALGLRRELTRNCALFRGMKPNQIKRVILLGAVRDVPEGQLIMRPGEPSREMYLVLSGRVRLLPSAPTDAGESPGYLMETGAVFGLVALVCREARIATARAESEARILGLDWERLQRLARFHPRTAAMLFRNLSSVIGERFRESLVCGEGGSPPAAVAVTDRPLLEEV